jgi:hypothetical protein
VFTRLGYVVIVAILAIAGAAIALVLWPSRSSDKPASPDPATPATAAVTVVPEAQLPVIPFSRVIDFARLGAVLSLDAHAQDITVTFREDFDTSGFSTTSHIFRSSLQPGQDIVTALEDAGIRVNGSGGVAVTKR